MIRYFGAVALCVLLGLNVALGQDNDPPQLTLSSPTRGEIVPAGTVRVAGTVTDASGVSILVVNGVPVIPDAAGNFAELVAVRAGMNAIEVEAFDPYANATQVRTVVLAGTFRPLTQGVPNALAARLNRPGFVAIEALAAQELARADLGALVRAQNPLYEDTSGLTQVTVTAEAASFGTPRLSLDPQAGGLAVRVEVPAVDMTVRLRGRLGFVSFNRTVRTTATLATITGRASLVGQPGGGLRSQMTNTQVALDGFRFDISGFPGFLESLIRGVVRRVLVDQIKKQIETTIPAQVDQALTVFNQPVTKTVLGRPVTLRLVPNQVVVDPDGAFFRADADVAIPALPGHAGPGSLATPGAAPLLGPTRAFALSLDDDLLNRVGYAAWQGGLMDFSLDRAAATQLGLPAWLPLEAFWLQAFLPSLIGHVDPRDPLEFELESRLPPVFSARPGAEPLQVSVGEFVVSIYAAPAGRARQLVLEVTTQVEFAVGVTVDAQNTLRLSVAGRPTVRTEVTASPLAQVNATGVATFVDFLIPPVIQLLPRAWSGFPLPVVPGGVQPRGLELRADGPAGDHLTLRGDL
ncbi:MAG: hypothetical protein KDD82_00490 [Planctomycetes bacterium]|nr:hypothetical protein [Planctomycetota bacterium]